MAVPKLYRKRYMPSEVVHLKDDIITYQGENVMVTNWDVLHPKAKFSHGVSCYYMDKGWKISKFLNKNDELVYYYCDIIDTTYNEEENLTVEQKGIINKDIIIRSLKQPTCISAKEEGNIINLEIEKELGIEIIGDTKVKITSVDEEETWENLDAEKTETKKENLEPTIDKINTNYIKREK